MATADYLKGGLVEIDRSKATGVGGQGCIAELISRRLPLLSGVTGVQANTPASHQTESVKSLSARSPSKNCRYTPRRNINGLSVFSLLSEILVSTIRLRMPRRSEAFRLILPLSSNREGQTTGLCGTQHLADEEKRAEIGEAGLHVPERHERAVEIFALAFSLEGDAAGLVAESRPSAAVDLP